MAFSYDRGTLVVAGLLKKVDLDYVANIAGAQNAHPPRTPLGPWAQAYGRVLGVCVFL